MRRKRPLIVGLAVVLAMCLWGLCTAADAYRLQSEFRAEVGVSPQMGQVIDSQRVSIAEKMRKNKIPGVAVALVDRERILWAAGFGYTDTDKKKPVTPETIFSIQSMSKTFTATAVLFAVQDGLLGLDAPITTRTFLCSRDDELTLHL
ncbi:MAG: serine hydrolase [Phycisphaerae bacterium]|nr:serine hydrolase [Phycisphaerae bacterium]